MSGIGHNSGTPDDTFSVSDEQLRNAGASETEADKELAELLSRVQRLTEEKKDLSDDIKDVYNEAKAKGYDVKIMRQIFRLMNQKPEDRREEAMLLETYKASLGMD